MQIIYKDIPKRFITYSYVHQTFYRVLVHDQTIAIHPFVPTRGQVRLLKHLAEVTFNQN